MSKYNVGTVEVTNGDATVIGTVTAFNTNVAAGDLFTLVGSATPYYVGSVTDATHLELTATYAGSSASGQSYTIQTSETTNHGLPYEEDGDIEIATIRKAALVKIDALLAATLTAGAILFGSATGALAADDTNLHWDDTENYVRLAGTGTMAALASGQAMLGGKTTTGATIRGYGSTYDVTIANRAGTTVLGIGPNNTDATFAGTGVFAGMIGTSHSTAGATAAYLYNLSATGFGVLTRGGGGTTEYIAQWLRYDGSERMTLTNTGLAVTGLGTFSSAVRANGAAAVGPALTALTASTREIGFLDSGSKASLAAFNSAFNTYSDMRYVASSHEFTVATTGAPVTVGLISSTGLYINDTSNANMTLGLTINQGAAADEILAFKSSDVAHGMTGGTETDTFGVFAKASSTDGGLFISGYSEATYGIALLSRATTEDGARSTSAIGTFILTSEIKSGVNTTTLSADKNLLVVRNSGTTRFILDSDGDSHQDVGTAWTNFDHLDDVATLNAVAYNVARADDPIKRKFGEWMMEKRDVLTAQKLVTFNDDGHHFVNMSKLTMLHTGAIRQIGERVDEHDRELEDLREFKARAIPALAARGITLQ